MPPREETLFMKLNEAAVGEPNFDEFASLDPDARSKAIAKRDATDKKKLERLEEVKKRTDELKMKRLASKVEKEEEKAKKKGTKKKVETEVQEPTTSAVDMMDTSSVFSLT